MNINYTWRHAEKTDAIEELTTKKLAKLERHCEKAASIHVTFDMINKQEHEAKASLHLPGAEINASAQDKDMYKAVDDLVGKLLRQVDEYKDKVK